MKSSILSHRFLRFCLVGTIGFLVDVAVLYALAGALGWYGARVLSFLAAVTATWILNRRFTFTKDSTLRVESPARTVRAEFLSYLLSMLGGAVVNYGVFALILATLSGAWIEAVGIAAGSVSGLFVNYFAAKNFVFPNKT